MVAVLVMVVVVRMVDGNPFFIGICTIIFLFYFYCEGFWLQYCFSCRVSTYVDLLRQ